MKKIGVMGGTFDPVHVGHLLLAEWAADAAGLEQVWFLPTGQSYMKSDREILPGQERLHMTELATAGNDRLKCLDLEIKREGYTYSYETMERLREAYPEDSFYFIEGADCLFTMENWKCPDRLLGSCTILAAVRSGASLRQMEEKRAELLEKFGGEIILMPFPEISVSSTEIRKRLREGRSVRYMVPDKVLAYIMEKGFYRESSDSSDD